MNRNAQIDKCCAEGWCSTGQNLAHMPRIYHICTQLKPKVIVETGVGATGHGSSTYTFLTIAKEMNAQLYSVDVEPQNLWFQKRFPDLDYTRWHFKLANSIEFLQFLHGEAKPIDFLHLDSNHGHDYVKGELEAAQPHLAAKCVIASHDTEPKPEHTREAMEEWAQKNGYTNKQFEDDHGFTLLTRNPELFNGLD